MSDVSVVHVSEVEDLPELGEEIPVLLAVLAIDYVRRRVLLCGGPGEYVEVSFGRFSWNN